VLLSDFDYHLPADRIAQEPLANRAASRMLVLDRASGRRQDRAFRDLTEFLRPGDCLVLNDSRVIPARLYGHRKGLRGQVEVLLLRTTGASVWQCLVHPGRKVRTGERIVFSEALEAEVVGRSAFGERLLRFECAGDFLAEIARIGHTPLPPYIRRADTSADRERYQTVFAREPGSAAAPTAGLHFTQELLDACRSAGAEIATVTLHVGLGTFQPLREENLQAAKLHAESYSISAESLETIGRARRRVVVGTTAVRTLETFARTGAPSGETDLFIRPGFDFRLTDALLTNFHLPRSSLLVLVCAFAGRDRALEAYRHAVEAEYRFYSYGDCMLIHGAG
jgi:S-adenosylmethionine:tRNA ribosyltransferase-isomerase